jgi:hypothetical protein
MTGSASHRYYRHRARHSGTGCGAVLRAKSPLVILPLLAVQVSTQDGKLSTCSHGLSGA